MRAAFLLLVLLASLAPWCDEVKDDAQVAALIADYKYHESCQDCHHHMWQEHGFRVLEHAGVEGIPMGDSLDNRYTCRVYIQCMYCQVETTGWVIPCTQKMIDQYLKNKAEK